MVYGLKFIHTISKCLYLGDLYLDLPIKRIKYFLKYWQPGKVYNCLGFLAAVKDKEFPLSFQICPLTARVCQKM